MSNYEKWKGKYCDCDASHFEVKDAGLYHKGVKFWKLEGGERPEQFNGMWNYYMAMND